MRFKAPHLRHIEFMAAAVTLSPTAARLAFTRADISSSDCRECSYLQAGRQAIKVGRRQAGRQARWEEAGRQASQVGRGQAGNQANSQIRAVRQMGKQADRQAEMQQARW